MKRLFICLWCFFIAVSISNAQTPPKRELRAAWLTTFLNLDWPSTNTRSVQQVKDSVSKLLDLHKQTGINAIYFQVRNECDAVYPSLLEPWSVCVTGVQGNAPADNFDPLQFVIDECRKRGIEIHAWLNPYRAVNNFNNIGSYASNHVANTNPDWMLQQGTLRILNPGIPAVRDYIISVMMDILRRYDVDGIHYDDYFYPYPGAGSTTTRFNDDATFAAFPRGFTNQNDWRRDNINLFIKRSYDSIKTVKPWVKFGISPFGIWRNQSSDAAGSATNGLQSFSDVFADSKKWIEQHWVDYLTPQIYWSIGFSAANYSVLAPWWNNQAFGRHIYSGQAVYKIAVDADANWNNPSQINNQIRLNRTYNNVLGSAFFRTRFFATNPLQFRDSLKQYAYTKPALLPVMPWRDNTAPQAVTNVTATVNSNHVQLSWTKPPSTTNELDKVKQFVVYRFNNATVNLNDVNAIQQITATDQITIFNDSNLAPAVYYYVVTSLDRFHNESVASPVREASLIPTTIAVTADENLTGINIKTYPNPATTHSIIEYTLTKRSHVVLQAYDANGRAITKLVDGIQSTGKQLVRFNTATLPAGIYHIRIQVEKTDKTIKIVVTK